MEDEEVATRPHFSLMHPDGGISQKKFQPDRPSGVGMKNRTSLCTVGACLGAGETASNRLEKLLM